MRTNTPLKIETDRRRNERMARTIYIRYLLEGSITAHIDLGEHIINNVAKGLKETLRSKLFLISQRCLDHSIVNLLCLTFWQ